MRKLFPERSAAIFADAAFADPGAGYRGAPFWSWNDRLDPERLRRQIGQLREMGFGGFHMHPRSGLATPYLGPAFMDRVRACVDEAARLGMLAWLYDEDRYASGYAGGLVTRELSYRQKFLRLAQRPMREDEVPAYLSARYPGLRRCHRVRIARYRIALDAAGRLAAATRLRDDEPDEPGLWHAYRELIHEQEWYNHQAYVDVLDPAAVRAFIAITHEAYRREVGAALGGTIPAIFTDEPHFKWSEFPAHPGAGNDCILPWTTDLPETYRQAWGEDLLDVVPQLLWDPPGDPPAARWRFRDHVAARFRDAYCRQIGDWCERHGLAATGHLNGEDSLFFGSMMAGDTMRHYRHFHLPGIDLLFDRFDLTTVKQAVSVARQDGRAGALSELYGVTNWDFPFSGHKRQGDWQAALGIAVRCHHLTHVSLEGHAKRDYPASIGPHSPWWREYRLVEDHFARLATALTRGRPVVRIAVIHPIESRWLTLGPVASHLAAADDQERAFQQLCRWLLDACLDFDYVAESILPEQCPQPPGGPCFPVGAMRYDAVVVPDLLTIRATTLARLRAFADAGGRVVFAGRVPRLVDALPSTQAEELAARCRRIPLGRQPLLAALDDLAEVVLVHDNPWAPLIDDVLHQLRADGERRWLFLACHARRAGERRQLVRVRGRWRATRYDTLDGTTAPAASRHVDGWTELAWDLAACGHLLVALDPDPAERTAPLPPRRAAWRERSRLADPVPVTLDEPNVLLLDQPEFRLDDGPWQPREELHRAENRLRRACGWPAKHGDVAQPWAVPPSGQRRTVIWRFAIDTAVAVAAPRLALEHPERARLRLDGREVPVADAGWWIDEAIRTVPLPDLAPGVHQLEVEQPFTPEGTLEWLYLLGDFAVRLAGRQARLEAPVRALAWGDWTQQGLPFYAGSVTYHLAIDGDGRPLAVRTPAFANPVLAVDLDGRRVGPIAFPPYRCELGPVAPGRHRLDLTCYGNRANALGAVHAADRPHRTDWGPNAWFTAGDAWTDGYQLWPQGVLQEPRLEERDG